MDKSSKNNKPEIRKAPFFVAMVFIVIWIIGILCGEPGRVMEQAVQICLSCIGIG